MTPPFGPPLGLVLAQTAKSVSRAFEAALAEAGGTPPMWFILISLKRMPTANQRQIAAAVGIQGATLTHHLNGMERDGLVVRQRDPDNRRVHVLRLTEAGEQAFIRLRGAAIAFDARLRTGLDEDDAAALARLLRRLDQNVSGTPGTTAEGERADERADGGTGADAGQCPAGTGPD